MDGWLGFNGILSTHAAAIHTHTHAEIRQITRSLTPIYLHGKGLYAAIAPIVKSCHLSNGLPLVVKRFQLPLRGLEQFATIHRHDKARSDIV